MPTTFTPGVSEGATCLWNGADGFASASASAVAQIGQLGVFAEGDSAWTDGVPAPGITAVGTGWAEFSDMLTISAGSQLVLNFDIAGSGNVPAFFAVPGNTVFSPTNYYEVLTPGGQFPIFFNYTPGTPFAIDVYLTVSTGAIAACNDLAVPPKCSASNVGDYSHTAKLTSVEVLDAQGNPLSNATITSDSGFDYSGSGPTQSTPEPAPWLLTAVIAGLALVVRQARYLFRIASSIAC